MTLKEFLRLALDHDLAMKVFMEDRDGTYISIGSVVSVDSVDIGEKIVLIRHGESHNVKNNDETD